MEDNKVERFIRLPEVLHLTGLSRTTLYEMIARREFPHPVALSLRSVAWIEGQVKEWMAMRTSTARNKK